MPSYSSYDLVSNHISRFFADHEVWVFDELVSPDFHLDVYLIKPAPGREFYTLLTSGVSSLAMNVPAPGVPDRVELMLMLPPDWPFDQDRWRTAEYYWPIELIKSLGRFPHDHQTWIGLGHTIPESSTSFLHQKGFSATILLKASSIHQDFQEIHHGQGFIDILMPVPLYASEYQYKRTHGLEGFLGAMTQELPDILSLDRPKVLADV